MHSATPERCRSRRKPSNPANNEGVPESRTIIDASAIVLILIPATHAVIRRFQDRFVSFSIHMALFLIGTWTGAAFVAAGSAYLALPVMAAAAGVSQYVYLRPPRND